jgi:small GTP-binding protein
MATHKDTLAGALSANEYKVIIIGSLGVGKTSLLLRFVHDTFEDRVSRFVAEEKKTVTVDGKEIVLDIWDTAGRRGCFSQGVG